MPDKQQLRDRLAAARRVRPPDELDRARRLVRAAVLGRARRDHWRTVAGYVPLRTEPGSLELLDALANAGALVLVPLLLPDRDLEWAAWPAADRPALGRAAVSGVDAVVVPAFAVALDGTRLGRGGGSYDRALARVPAGVPRVALLFDDELLADLPRDGWDQPVTAVVTPAAGWQDLGRPH